MIRGLCVRRRFWGTHFVDDPDALISPSKERPKSRCQWNRAFLLPLDFCWSRYIIWCLVLSMAPPVRHSSLGAHTVYWRLLLPIYWSMLWTWRPLSNPTLRRAFWRQSRLRSNRVTLRSALPACGNWSTGDLGYLELRWIKKGTRKGPVIRRGPRSICGVYWGSSIIVGWKLEWAKYTPLIYIDGFWIVSRGMIV